MIVDSTLVTAAGMALSLSVRETLNAWPHPANASTRAETGLARDEHPLDVELDLTWASVEDGPHRCHYIAWCLNQALRRVCKNSPLLLLRYLTGPRHSAFIELGFRFRW